MNSDMLDWGKVIVTTSVVCNSLSILAIVWIGLIFLVDHCREKKIVHDYHTFLQFCLLLSDFIFSVVHCMPPFSDNACAVSAYQKITTLLASLLSVTHICTFMYSIVILDHPPCLVRPWHAIMYIFLLPAIVACPPLFFGLYGRELDVPQFDYCLWSTHNEWIRMALDQGLDIVPLIISEVWIIYSITAMKRFLRKFPNETTTKIIDGMKWYPLVQILVFIPYVIMRIAQYVLPEGNKMPELFVADKISLGLMGFLNVIVYSRKTRVRWRETLCCCFIKCGPGCEELEPDDSLELSRTFHN